MQEGVETQIEFEKGLKQGEMWDEGQEAPFDEYDDGGSEGSLEAINNT